MKLIQISTLLFILLLNCMNIVNAAILKDEKNLNWASKRDLTSSQFSQDFDKYRRQNLMMIDVDGYTDASGVLYSMVWRENTDKRGWAELRDMSSATYHQKWSEYRDKGFRPLDVETYIKDGRRMWAGIWVENVEKWDWSSHRGLTSAEHAALFADMSERGFRIIDIEVYSTSKGHRYNSIWYFNFDHRGWFQLRDMTRASYLAEVDDKWKDGFKVVDFESYQTNKGQRYAAIWEKKPGFAWQVRTERTKQEFVNLWHQYADEGYRLIDFERYQTSEGYRYAGVWAENASRFQYNKKSQIDNLISSYRSINNLPGISVAIIDNGTTIYRRGFGLADVANNKTAHTKTVYNSASVAKLVGGTLMAKLADEGELTDGTTFSLDVTNPTSTYIAGLPAAHTHNVNELLSHLSCVGHYQTTPSIANQTTHYDSATEAMQSIWNIGLINGCTPGTAWNYSTPAFTFAGAVLESVTGKTVNELLEEELFIPFGLSSMRVQYDTNALPAN
ncbi:MAG: serine hydrolase, partial [Gammaproteobacteria bacterium]|nr:serine hydrolase [Gammaproteobacteria bacterium]